jgi:hypothetical protein
MPAGARIQKAPERDSRETFIKRVALARALASTAPGQAEAGSLALAP